MTQPAAVAALRIWSLILKSLSTVAAAQKLQLTLLGTTGVRLEPLPELLCAEGSLAHVANNRGTVDLDPFLGHVAL